MTINQPEPKRNNHCDSKYCNSPVHSTKSRIRTAGKKKKRALLYNVK